MQDLLLAAALALAAVIVVLALWIRFHRRFSSPETRPERVERQDKGYIPDRASVSARHSRRPEMRSGSALRWRASSGTITSLVSKRRC